jgi:NIPSNAP
MISGIVANLTLALSLAGSPNEGTTVYELRTYTTEAGKLPVLLERFEKSNLQLFKKHGIELIGAWTPATADEAGERLVYLVRFPSRDGAMKAWESFGADPDWKAVFAAEKEKHGNVVRKVENVFLAPTDYSPEPGQVTAGPSLYELRTYVASPDRLDKLNSRFRDHTLKLFAKHGMKNILYTVPMDSEKGSANTLIYLIDHADRASAAASWKAFGDDPEWKKVYAESQSDGVKLAEKVLSVYLTPTSFSPLK